MKNRAIYLSIVLVLLLVAFAPSMTGSVVMSAIPEPTLLSEESIHIDNSYVSVTDPLVSAIAAALERRPPDLLDGTRFALTSARIEGDWALVSIASLDGPNSDTRHVGTGGSGGLVIAVRNRDGFWQAALQSTDEFSTSLGRAPDQFIHPDAKALLTPDPAFVRTPSSVEYKFPWAAGLSWIWTQSWHPPGYNDHHDMGTSGGDKRLLAAAGGVVTYICWGTLSANVQIQDADGVVMGYSHIDRNTLESCISEGITVSRGQVLGSLRPDTWSDSCGYTNQNPGFAHVHWGIPNDRAITVDGWTIQYPSDCWEKDGTYKCFQYPFLTFPSTNQPVYGCTCCGCLPANCCTGGLAQADGSSGEFRWDNSYFSNAAASMLCTATDGPVSWDAKPPITTTASMTEPAGSSPKSTDPINSSAIVPQRTPPASTHYRIPKSVFGSSGGHRTSAHYVMQGTSGQTTGVDQRESNHYILQSGYWGGWTPGLYNVYLPILFKQP